MNHDEYFTKSNFIERKNMKIAIRISTAILMLVGSFGLSSTMAMDLRTETPIPSTQVVGAISGTLTGELPEEVKIPSAKADTADHPQKHVSFMPTIGNPIYLDPETGKRTPTGEALEIITHNRSSIFWTVEYVKHVCACGTPEQLEAALRGLHSHGKIEAVITPELFCAVFGLGQIRAMGQTMRNDHDTATLKLELLKEYGVDPNKRRCVGETKGDGSVVEDGGRRLMVACGVIPAAALYGANDGQLAVLLGIGVKIGRKVYAFGIADSAPGAIPEIYAPIQREKVRLSPLFREKLRQIDVKLRGELD
jgi:hypothetical protein